jgi:hypothetical protein
MENLVRSGLICLALIVASVPAMAQSTQGSTPPDAADQFKAAGQHISEGAQAIGQGIKQGAIQSWQAIKAGASATADKLNGRPAAPAPHQAPGNDSH